MSRRPGKPDEDAPTVKGGHPGPSADRPATPVAGAGAFDIWLERGLHKLFDDIAQEPVPAALLKIIEQDRQKG